MNNKNYSILKINSRLLIRLKINNYNKNNKIRKYYYYKNRKIHKNYNRYKIHKLKNNKNKVKIKISNKKIYKLNII